MCFKKLALIVGIILQTYCGFGQYFQFSQNNFTGQRVNPGTVSATDYTRASLVYRNQKVSDGQVIKSTFLEGSYPLFNSKRRWAGIGISLLDDRSGYAGMFKTKEFGLSYSATVPLNKYSNLNLGFRTVYQDKKISFDGLTTGTQFVPGHGMIGANNGEDLDNFKTDHITFSTGIYWQSTDRKLNKKAYAGISLFDFNRPQENFYSDQNRLSSTWLINGGFQVYEKNGFSILPEFLFTHSASKGMFNVGPVFTYDLYKSMYSNRPGKVNLITKYASGNYLIAGIQFEKEKFALGFSYDIPVGDNVSNLGSIEFGAEFKQLIKNKNTKKSKKNRIKKEKTKKKKVVKKKKKKKKSKKKSKNNKKSKIKKPVRREQLPTKEEPVGEAPIVVEDNNDVKEDQPEKDSEKAIIIEPVENKEEENSHQEELVTEVEDADEKKIGTSAQSGKVKYLPLELEGAVLHFNFDFGKTDMNQESIDYLMELVNVLKGDPALKITIIGHTDDVGNESYNQQLSEERAKVVADFLISKGVKADRIGMDGKGESEPLVENDTPDNRAINRRVDFMIGY